MTLLLVLAGAAVGAPLRYLVGLATPASAFPFGTLIVNVAGSFLLGFLVALPADPATAALLGTGFCGALTTYSTFSYETLRLARSGARLLAAANAVGSVLAGLGAAALGALLAAVVS